MMVCQPFSERARQVKKFGFIKEREFHAGIAIKSADVDLNGASFKNAAVGGDVGVFVAVPLFAAEDDQVDDGGDGLFGAFDILGAHLRVDRVGNEIGSSLQDIVSGVEIDFMGQAEPVDESDRPFEVIGFVEVEVDERGFIREFVESEFIASVFLEDPFFSFGEFEVAVFVDERNVVEIRRLPKMTLLEEFEGVLAVLAEEDKRLAAAGQVRVFLREGLIYFIHLSV